MQKILVLLVLVFVAILLGWGVPQLSGFMPIFIIAGIALSLATLVNTNFGLILLLFSMLLSPELSLGKLSDLSYREIVIRLDDILLISVFVTWFVKAAVLKNLGLFKHSPLNRPIVIYMFICFFVTGKAILAGEIGLLSSALYLLKYFEYFMVYFMYLNVIHNRRQTQRFLIAFLVTGCIISVFAASQIGKVERTSTPFEQAAGEANTLGGYLVLVIGICAGLFLYSRSVLQRVLLGGLICLAIPPFLFTLSRGGYAAFIAMYLVFVMLSRKKKILLISLMCLAVITLPVLLPEKVITRVTGTFLPGPEEGGKRFDFFGRPVTLELSAAQRIDVWEWIFEKWQERPIIGFGVTGVGFVDNQYALVLGEGGLLGFISFIWLLVAIFTNGLRVFHRVEDDYSRGLTLGFLAGFVGICIQGLTGNIFLILRIMEPFWFLAAMVIMLPEVADEGMPQEDDQNMSAIPLRGN